MSLRPLHILALGRFDSRISICTPGGGNTNTAKIATIAIAPNAPPSSADNFSMRAV